MIPVNEFRSITSEQNPQFRVLKPWWDVLSEYLGIAMLMMGVFGCTLQLTQDKISCLPNRFTDLSGGDRDCSHLRQENESLWEFAITKRLGPNVVEVFGRKNGLDIHQYEFVNHFCYERAVHWYGKYFPYLVVIHSMIFMVASSFWFKFPGTSSKIELFVIILGKCFDSPWTTRAISKVYEERREERMVVWRKNTMTKSAADNNDDIVSLIRSSIKSGSDQKPSEATASLLDKKEGEQAKALFEKVRKFRTHVEEADLLYFMYVLQTALKVFKFALITVYSVALVPNIQIMVMCSVPPDLTGFSAFCSYCYICFVGVYGLLCIYSLFHRFHRPLKEYSFEAVRMETGINDIPDVKNDFAFLLHLSDQYDALYSKRFAVFLSEVSECRLRQLNLNHEWTADKLRARLTRNAAERLELPLFLLPGLPDTVFEISEVESLKLELISNVTVPGTVSQLTALQEIVLIHSPAKLQLAALSHLRENLKVLRLGFEGPEQVPLWMYTLQSLEELHLSGALSAELSRSPALDSLRDLKNLRVLTLRCKLTKIPPSIVDVSSQLQRLCVHNEGTRLQVYNSLKKLVNLSALELTGCGLERIPSAVFSLSLLQELDLRENRLSTVEEILSLQHCRRLTVLRLRHNDISCVAEHISKLRALETLDLSWNKIRSLPPRLCYCTKLRHLDLSHNQLASLPSEIGVLQCLQFLSVAFNSLESLPEELFSCKRLQVLALGNNSISSLSPRVGNLAQLVRLELKGNRLESLPAELADCLSLRLAAVIVEDGLTDLLPPDVKDRMKRR
uniref:Volume-regulated anion channel subunit LRRC8C-like n=1 Tax=Sinocyclocheilus anshuiensis TaxID=1608454 RepID=A0A671T689_9TELE